MTRRVTHLYQVDVRKSIFVWQTGPAEAAAEARKMVHSQAADIMGVEPIATCPECGERVNAITPICAVHGIIANGAQW